MFKPTVARKASTSNIGNLLSAIGSSDLPSSSKEAMVTHVTDMVLSKGQGPKQMQATANYGSTPVPTGTNLSASDMPIYLDPSEILRGFFYEGEETQPNFALSVYYDIYNFDPTCGTVVDMISVLPYCSGFNLQPGISGMDDEMLAVYDQNLSALHCSETIPQLSIETLVTGRSASSVLLDNSSDKPRFMDLICYDPMTLVVKPSGMRNMPSTVRGSLGNKHREMLNDLKQSNSELYDLWVEAIGADAEAAILQAGLKDISPQGLLFLQNEMHPQAHGVSLYRRVLPLWFYEKNLFRGTLTESIRRQRGVQHMILGDENWTPQPDDFIAYASALQQAAADPLSSIFATRSGVSISDILEGGQFWKVDDLWTTTPAIKCRAMGVPESLAGGDGVYALESGINTTIDMLRRRRSYIDSAMFYKKLLPLIALSNEFMSDSCPAEARQLAMDSPDKTAFIGFMLKYGGMAKKYLRMPRIEWKNPLTPVKTLEFFDLIDKMTEKGYPMEIRTMCAAAGVDLEETLAGKDADLRLRKRLKEFSDQIKEINPPPAQDGGFGGGFEGGASSSAFTRVRPRRKEPMRAVAKQDSISYDPDGNMYRHEHDGRPRLVRSDKEAKSKENTQLMQAFRNLRKQR